VSTTSADSIPTSDPPRGTESDSRSAEPPHAVPRDSQKRERRQARAVFLGYLFYLQRQRRLSEDQERYLLELQRKVRMEELQRSIKLLEGLLSSPRSAARAEQDLRSVQLRCPRLQAKSVLPERRRIGVGYRDKGSLRAQHQPAPIAGRMWWSEDLPLLESNRPEEPRWITAEELYSPERYEIMQEILILAWLQNSTTYLRTPRARRRL
jgi:hypothetical protein